MTTATTPCERLREAREHVQTALAIVDEVAPHLPDPEQNALTGVMGSRHELARIARQLETLAKLTDAEGSKR